MTVRERFEKMEEQILSPYAALSLNSRGRTVQESPCDIRTCFQRDRDRIIHSKSFRRLKDKTQVFLTPQWDQYRTRLTHTLEVSQIARTIARALGLNEDLTEAIALGHDLGHTPFGHAGERALNAVCPLGFVHSEQSVRVTDLMERGGKGLNLTWEVRDGIRNHRSSGHPATLEGKVVRLSDKVAYMHHDMDDAIRAGILKNDRVPDEIARVLGETTGERLDTLIKDIIYTSMDRNEVEMSERVGKAGSSLRNWMFENVYTAQRAKSQEGKAQGVVKALYSYFMEEKHTGLIPGEYLNLWKERGEPLERVVCDYVSSMTDRYAIAVYKELFVPDSWKRDEKLLSGMDTV